MIDNDSDFSLIGLVVIGILIIIGFRLIGLNTLPSYNSLCQWENNGSDWYYKNTIYGDTCEKINYTTLQPIDRRPLNMSGLQEKYCDYIEFWDLRRWSNECSKEGRQPQRRKSR